MCLIISLLWRNKYFQIHVRKCNAHYIFRKGCSLYYCSIDKSYIHISLQLFYFMFLAQISVHCISLVVPHVVSSFYFIGCSTRGQFILFHWLFHAWSVHFISLVVPHMVSSFPSIVCSTRGQFILFHWLFHAWSVHFISLIVPHVVSSFYFIRCSILDYTDF